MKTKIPTIELESGESLVKIAGFSGASLALHTAIAIIGVCIALSQSARWIVGMLIWAATGVFIRPFSAGALIFCVFAIPLAIEYARLRTRSLYITDRRIVAHDGAIFKKTTVVSLDMSTSVAVSTGPIARYAKFGKIVICYPSSKIAIKGVAAPQEIADEISREITRSKQN